MDTAAPPRRRRAALRGYLRRLPESAAVAVWLAANLFVLGTRATYTGNRDMFSLPFGVLLRRYYLQPFAALVLVLVGAALLMPTMALYRIYVVLLFGVAVMTWAQGNFLVWNYGVFDGTQIDFAAHRWVGMGELAVWLLVLAGLLVCRRRVYRHVGFVAGGLCVLQGLLALASPDAPVAAPAVATAPGGTATVRERPAAVFEFSSAANVIVYLSDGFQSDIFREIVQGPEPFAEALDGFTFFADTSTNSRLTVGAYPAILSGVMYDGSVPYRTYAQQTVAHDNIGPALGRKGYALAYVLQSGNLYYQPEHCVGPFAFVDRFFAEDVAGQTLLDATLFRHAPHFLKPYVYDGTSGIAGRLVAGPRRLQAGNETAAYIDFMNVMEVRATRRDGPPTFKLFHLLNAHPPLSVNERCEFERLSSSRASYTRSNVCSLKTFVRFLARLRALGVYDNSLIIFLGDHGAKGEGTGIAPVVPGLQVGDAWPALAVKPPNSHGPLRISHAPAQVADVAATIAALTGADGSFPGRSLLSLREGEERVRYFFLGKPGERWDQTTKQPPTRVDFLIRGPVGDVASWSPLESAAENTHALPPGVFSSLRDAPGGSGS